MQESWPETAEPPALAADDVHVWSVPLDAATRTVAELEAVLAADERERAERFRLDDARRRFVVARAALRTLLGDTVDAAGRSLLRLRRERQTAFSASTATDLQFNLAHSGELALVAVTRGCEVGVDVERLRDVHHWQEIAERYFHPRKSPKSPPLQSAEQTRRVHALLDRQRSRPQSARHRRDAAARLFRRSIRPSRRQRGSMCRPPSNDRPGAGSTRFAPPPTTLAPSPASMPSAIHSTVPSHGEMHVDPTARIHAGSSRGSSARMPRLP